MVKDTLFITAQEAGCLIDRSTETIRRYVRQERLPGERRGYARQIYVPLAAVLALAEELNLPVNEEMLKKLRDST